LTRPCGLKNIEVGSIPGRRERRGGECKVHAGGATQQKLRCKRSLLDEGRNAGGTLKKKKRWRRCYVKK